MSEKTLYFGYGSNLDHEDWSGWCEDRDLDPSGLVELGPAWLPDFDMKFHYYSNGREGGAADVVYAGPGHAVPGALFEMDEKAHKAMDRKEGHPNYYERRDVNVILPRIKRRRQPPWHIAGRRVWQMIQPRPTIGPPHL